MAGLGRKSQELSQRGIVEKHGYGWRAHFAHIRICEEKDTSIRGPLRDSRRKALADLKSMRECGTAAELVARAARLKDPNLPASVSNEVFLSTQRLSLCGLNVQYPWSRLLMLGRKKMEERKYALGHYQCFSEGEQLFLIETVGAGSTKGAIVDTEIGPPPSRAQVLGIITFAGATEFLDDRDFDSHRQDTLIEVDSPFDWWSSGARRFFGWVVLDVKAFKMPVSVGGRPRSMLGWTKPVELSFQFEVAE